MKFANLTSVIVMCMTLGIGNVHAEKLTLFQCKDHIAAETCSVGCYDKFNMQVDFLVEKNDGNVMERRYLSGSSPTSIAYSKCKIFNGKNWDCSEEPFWTGKWYVYQEIKMTSGVYSARFYTSERKLNAESTTGNYCAKPSASGPN